MIPAPTDDVRAIRRELAARFGNDIHRIVEETQRRERESGQTFISLPPRAPQHADGSPRELLLERDANSDSIIGHDPGSTGPRQGLSPVTLPSPVV